MNNLNPSPKTKLNLVFIPVSLLDSTEERGYEIQEIAARIIILGLKSDDELSVGVIPTSEKPVLPNQTTGAPILSK